MIPQLIGTLTFPSTQPVFNGRIGPYERVAGDFAYVIVGEIASPTAHVNIVAYKTPAQPDPNYCVTWTRVAAAGETPNGRASVFYPGTGDVLYVGYQDSSSGFQGALQSIEFDMATETFTAADPVGTGVINNPSVMLLKLSSGDKVIFYDKSSNGVFARVKSAGVWGAELTINGSAFTRLNGALLVTDTNIKVLGNHFSGNITSLFCATFDGATVTGTSTAFTVSGTDFVDPYVAPGVYDAANDKVGWAIVNVINGNLENEIFVISAQASIAAPAFTSTLVYEDLDTFDSLGAPINLVPITGGFQTAWELVPSDASADKVYTSIATALDGAWSLPALYYDLAADPPSPPPTNNTIFPIFSNKNPDGTAQFIIGLTQAIETHHFCGVLYSLPVPFVPPVLQTLQLNKEVIGGSLSAADFILTATGSDSPTTVVTGPGPQVGPSPVPAITFHLGEAFGPTWDDATGTWASNSTHWNGGYTTTGYVCTGGGVQPDPYTVIVPVGANIVCTIVNTAPIPPIPPQPGSPCGGPITPQPATDVQFELRRVYASMKPAPRIPVRGS